MTGKGTHLKERELTVHEWMAAKGLLHFLGMVKISEHVCPLARGKPGGALAKKTHDFLKSGGPPSQILPQTCHNLKKKLYFSRYFPNN